MSSPNDQAALEARNEHISPLNGGANTTIDGVSPGIATNVANAPQGVVHHANESNQEMQQHQHHVMTAPGEHHHHNGFRSDDQLLPSFAMEGVVLSGHSIHGGQTFAVSPTLKQHEGQQISQSAGNHAIQLQLQPPQEHHHHQQHQQHQHQEIQGMMDRVSPQPLPPNQPSPQSVGSLALGTPPAPEQTMLMNPLIVPLDSQSMAQMHPMSFQQAVEMHGAKVHFPGPEQQNDQRQQQQQQQQQPQPQPQQHHPQSQPQPQLASQVFVGGTSILEMPVNPSVIAMQEQMNSQLTAETPVLPSQQPSIQPIGMHRHQLSIDGHISPPMDLGLLNAHIQQQQQHLQEQLHLQRQQQQQQVQNIMAAAALASSQGVLSSAEGSAVMMPVNQNVAVMPSTQEAVLNTSTGMVHHDIGPHMIPSMPQHQHQSIQSHQQHRHQHQQPGLTMPMRIEGDVFVTSFVPSGGPTTPGEGVFGSSISSAEPIAALTPLVPSMQPLPMSTTSTPAFTSPDSGIASIADPTKRHQRHPSSGHHSPELQMMFPTQEFFQQQQQLMAAKEQAICENLHKVEAETHQHHRFPRTGAAGLKIDVADIQARAMPPLSAVASPAESGHLFSPGPLSGPSPIMGPVCNSLMDAIAEASSNLRLQNPNDPLLTPVKLETMEVIDLSSARPELAELSKRELIEKVMEYERQIEGNFAMRRASVPKVEAMEGQTPSELTAVSSPVHHQQSQMLTFSALNPSPSTPQSLASAQEAPKETETKVTSPQLTTTAVKSSTESTAAIVSSQHEEEDDEDADDDEEENEDDIEEDDNDDDVEGGMESKLRVTKRNIGASDTIAGEEASGVDSETPQQLVCLWRDCNTPFDSMDKLNEHVAENHIGSGKACYSCDWQGCHRQQKPFTKRHKMYNHLRTHTGERPFRCLVPGCDKKFSRPDSLTTHTKTHSNVRPYVCPIEGCPKAYYHARSLKKHELAHEAKRGGHRALRGPGSNVTTPGSATDASTGSSVTPGLAGAQSQQQQHSHFSHPYHPDFTGQNRAATKHHGHQRQLSQPMTFNLAMTPDSAMPSALLPTGNMSSGGNSPSPGALTMTPGYSPGLNGPTTVIKPVMSNHSSTSSVPSLSMVMSSASMADLGGQGIMAINPAFTQQQGNLGMSGIALSPGHHVGPNGSPGFPTATVVPSSVVNGPTHIPTSVNADGSMTMAVPMAVDMTMVMPMNTISGHGVNPSPPILNPLPLTNANMNMTPLQGIPTDMTAVQSGILEGNNLYTIPAPNNCDPHHQMVSSMVSMGSLNTGIPNPMHVATSGAPDQGLAPQSM